MTLKEKLEQYIDSQIDVIHLEQVADDYVIEVLEWLTNEKSEYSIMYGNQEKRFSTIKKDYTAKELLEIFKNNK